MWYRAVCRESGVTQYQCQDIRQPFIELNRILASLQERELGPALAWVQANRHTFIHTLAPWPTGTV